VQENKQVNIQDAPCELELEQEILGSIILDDRLIREMVDTVPVPAFYQEEHRTIYTAMLYLYHNNLSIGYETLINRLKTKKETDDSVLEYIFDLRNVVMSTDEFDLKIEILMDTYHKRVLYNEALYIVTEPIKGVASQNLVNKIEKSIENMGITSNIEYERFEDYIDEWVKYQEDETPVQSHKLGFRMLDDLVLLEDSNLMYIGARPSVGKSAFATNIVKNFCLQNKHPLFVSLEMNKREFMNRLVANMAHVPARKLKRKEAKTSAEWASIMKAKNAISKFKFNFFDKGGMSIEQLHGLARYLKKKGELDVIVIDYLQLLETAQYKGQKQNQVSYISQKLKQIAMELDIPVIALAQLNRGVVTDGGNIREPVLSDLRDSGSLEQDANIVIMLHTDDIDQKFDSRFVKLFVRKNRDGRLGQVNYTYIGDYVEFVEKKFDTSDPMADKNGYVIVQQEDFGYSLDDKETDNEFGITDDEMSDLPF
jgi:replicative DNA helicase